METSKIVLRLNENSFLMFFDIWKLRLISEFLFHHNFTKANARPDYWPGLCDHWSCKILSKRGNRRESNWVLTLNKIRFGPN